MTDTEILDAISDLLKKRAARLVVPDPPTVPIPAPTLPSVAVVDPLAGIVIPGSYDDLYKYYGDPKAAGFAAKFITTVSHEVGGRQTAMQVHRVIAPLLHLIWADMTAAGLVGFFKTFDGAFVVRNIIGSTHPSLHSWGIALDLNAAEYPLGSLKRWPDEILNIWRKYGFFYGGDFNGRRDGMHVQFSKPHSI
jgi:hypothetical protein